MKNPHYITFLMLLLASSSVLFGQTGADTTRAELDENLYQASLYKLKSLLIKEARVDTLVLDLVGDAKQLADSQQWSEATQLLLVAEELLIPAKEADLQEISALLKEDAGSDGYPPGGISSQAFPAYFQVESGIDFSRQAYQLSLEERTLVDQLQSGFVNIDYYHPLGLGSRTALLNHSFQADNQYLTYELNGNLELRTAALMQRFDLRSGYFMAQEPQLADFNETSFSYLLGRPYSLDTRWYLDSRARAKWHPQPDSLNSDILSASFTGYLEHFLGFNQSLSLSLTPSWYREQHGSQFEYTQQRASGYYRFREGFNQYLEVGMEAVRNDFQDEIEDTLYQNRYLSLEPQLEAEWPLVGWFGLKSRVEWEMRRYRVSDVVNPDFVNRKAEGIARFYRSPFQSFGMGYFYEDQRHQVDRQSDFAFAEEGDFIGHGLIVEVEYLRLQGLMIDLTYQLSWRNYPNSEDSYFNAYYSDRLIHSVSLFAWVPITAKWQIQLFANFDDDRDREFEQNDTRSTILNASLIYKF